MGSHSEGRAHGSHEKADFNKRRYKCQPGQPRATSPGYVEVTDREMEALKGLL